MFREGILEVKLTSKQKNIFLKLTIGGSILCQENSGYHLRTGLRIRINICKKKIFPIGGAGAKFQTEIFFSPDC